MRTGINPKMITPSETDFVSDVEIQARRALTKDGDWSRYWLFIGLFGNVTETAGLSHKQIIELMLQTRGVVGMGIPQGINNVDVVNEIKWAVGDELKRVLRKRNPTDALKAYRRGKEVGSNAD
jgi:hypothetical protein